MARASLLFSLLLNIVSSIGVIIVNKKLVFMMAGFRFSTVLTIIHFIMTFVGCLFFAYGLRLVTPKHLSIREVLPISCAFCGYVVFNNLSLLTNSVSVYQEMKILCTPIIIAIERTCYGKQERTSTLLSLIPVCLGVAVTFYSDSDVNVVGTIWASLAIVANSLYTIWGKTKQQELNAQPMQLLLYQAPISAAMLLFVAVPLDGYSNLAAYTVNFTTVWTVLLSCVFAFGVNFSFFLFVGKTSPLTMNVVGYLKTSLVFVLDFIFVSADIFPQKVLGILLTLVGLAVYSHSRMESPALRSPKVEPEKQNLSPNTKFLRNEVHVVAV